MKQDNDKCNFLNDGISRDNKICFEKYPNIITAKSLYRK